MGTGFRGQARPVALGIAALGLCLTTGPAGAQLDAASFQARVVGVSDGDTVTVLTDDRRKVKVRLAEIDAPETRQPYGTRSKRELSSIVFGRTVTVVPRDVDRYGRTVARIRVGGSDASAAMIGRGAAWVFTQYSTDASLRPLQAAARRARRGLWALPEQQRVPPWQWRQVVRARGRALLPSSPTNRLPWSQGRPSGGPSCSAKRICGQMSSCQEAVYHLRVCHQTRLDSDGDGKPCERLCG